ncbi:MAG: ABC transporter ATP-binding protein [Actinomycetia bacterium]|nr:ABC transporter ATP-binding protein [Actinomycetes bacterium]
MTTAIHVENLSKAFGSTQALDGLDLTVEAGQVMGFLGPNGSGKSTTIRVLMGLLRHDSGEVQVLGQDPWHDAVELHKRIAYVPGDVNLWPGLTGGETIDLFGRLGAGLDPKRRSEMIERFDLDPTKKGRTYSKGNRQKVALVAALAGDAELFVFDEPTAGLDPLMETVFQNTISEMLTDGKTVLLSSHILAEVESLCDQVTIIREGRTVEAGTLAELRYLTRTSVEATTTEPIGPMATADGVSGFEAHGEHHASFAVANSKLAEVMSRLAELGIEAIESQPPTLEELFMRHYAVEQNHTVASQ